MNILSQSCQFSDPDNTVLVVLWKDLFYDLKPASHSDLSCGTLLPQHLTLYLLNIGSTQQNFSNVFQEQKAHSGRRQDAGKLHKVHRGRRDELCYDAALIRCTEVI